MATSLWSGVTFRRKGPRQTFLFRGTLVGTRLTLESGPEGGPLRVTTTNHPAVHNADRALDNAVRKKLLDGFLHVRPSVEAKVGQLCLVLRPPGAGPGRNFDVDPTGRRVFLVAGRGDRKATSAVVDLEAGTIVTRPVAADSPGRQLFVHAVLISADASRGWYLLNETLREQDLATGKERKLLAFDEGRDGLNPFCVMPERSDDHARILTPAPGGLAVLDAATRRRICHVKIGTRTAECRAIGLSPSGATFAALVISRHLVYGHADAASDATNEVQVYSADTGSLKARIPLFDKVDAVGVSFDDRQVLTTRDGDGPGLLGFDGKVRAARQGSTRGCSAWAYSPDGKILAVGGRGGQLELLDPRTLKAMRKRVTSLYRCDRVAFSGDGRTLLVSGDGIILGFRV